jgi:hypothetical protein
MPNRHRWNVPRALLLTPSDDDADLQRERITVSDAEADELRAAAGLPPLTRPTHEENTNP